MFRCFKISVLNVAKPGLQACRKLASLLLEYNLHSKSKSMNKQTQAFEGKMNLTFVKEQGRWYVDLPQFLESGAGTKADLEMVAGADTFCDELTNGGDRLNVTISTEPFTEAEYSIKRTNNGKKEGRDYATYKKQRFILNMWLCPVLLYVMGSYPDTVYIQKH